MCQLHKMIFHKVRIMNIIGECNQVCFVAAKRLVFNLAAALKVSAES